jgi:peptidoglycan hydrolase CwlO-like protein
LIKIIKVFNFASTYKNPSDILKDFLKNKNIKLRQAQANKRKEINDIESLYNELSIIVNSTKEVKNEEKQSIINPLNFLLIR